MVDNLFETIFLIGLLAYLFGVYTPQRWRLRRDEKQKRITDDRDTKLDYLLMILSFVGWQVIPAIYVLTGWWGFADYHLPTWTGWVGVVIFVLSLWLLWRSYADIGRNWSASLQTMKGHSLVTHGVYQRIRHPTYAAVWLWGIAQPLLLHNWIAGFAHLVLFAPLYLLRVPREEQMMLDRFGDEYREYMERTGRLIPRF
jgi:protein-S-isoprenylcysteine O-methyltransferase Ste14